MRILVVEDDREAAAYLLKGLTESGHVVNHSADGDDGLHMALSGSYDAMVLDRMLPKRDGLTLLKMLRADGNDTPVMLLTALGEVDDRVEGLRAGSDDYLVKPYAFAELQARLEVISRRKGPAENSSLLVFEDLELDVAGQTASRAGQPLSLLPRELKLLEVLMRNAGRVLTRTMLLEKVWDLHFDPQSNVVDTQVCRLRGKIDRGRPTPLLRTIRGGGYRLG